MEQVLIGQGRAVSLKAIGFEGVLGVKPRVLALEKSVGDSFFTDITTENTTGSPVTKDYMAGFGHYDPDTGTFTLIWGHAVLGVSIPTGTHMETVDCVASVAGSFDAMGAIGTYVDGSFTIDSGIALIDALHVTGVVVTDVSLHQ